MDQKPKEEALINDELDSGFGATASDRKQLQAGASGHQHLRAPARNRTQVPEIADAADLPKDDVYIFPIKSAVAYAVLQGATIPERTIYDNCQFGRDRNTLKCVRLKGELIVGTESLDAFIHERKKSDAMRGRERPQEIAGDNEQGREHTKGVTTQPSEEMLKENKELNVRVGQLESDKRELEILNAGNKIVIDKITKDADKFVVQLTEQSRMIGRLETQLQLTAPKDTSSAVDDESTEDQSLLNNMISKDNIHSGDNS